MAGIQARIIRQGQDLAADAVHQRGVIAAGQVGAANAAGKEHIANEGDLLGGAVEHHMAGGVAGDVAHFESSAAQGKYLAVFQGYIRVGGRVHVQAKERRTAARLPERQVGRVQRHAGRGLQRLQDGRCAANMIEMRMRHPYLAEAQVAPSNLGCQEIAAPGRVNNDHFARLRVAEQVTIGHGRPQLERNDT